MSQYDKESVASSNMSMNTNLKIEALMNKFAEMDKNADNVLTKDEVLQFFKDNSTPQKQFDQRFLLILLKSLGFNNEVQEITVEDFIDGYLQMDKTMQQKLIKTNADIQNLELKYEDCKKECAQYKDEKLNSDGFCENSRIEFAIDDINMADEIQDMRTISIILKYNNSMKTIQFRPGEFGEQEKEKVEFKPKRKDDPFQIILKGTDEKGKERDLGAENLTLEPNENQEEYELEISIPGLQDEKNILATIKANILFYYSDYIYYENRKNQTKKTLDKLRENQQNIMKVIDNINEIYGLKDQQNPNKRVIKPKNQFLEDKKSQSSSKKNYPNTGNQFEDFDQEDLVDSMNGPGGVRKGGKRPQPNDNLDSKDNYDSNLGLVNLDTEKMPNYSKENQTYPPVIEEQFGSFPKDASSGLMRKMSYALLATSALSALYKPDFINVFVGAFLLLLTSEDILIPFFKNLQIFLYSDLGALIYNIIWLLCNFKSKKGYEDNHLRLLAVILTLVTAAIEGFLGFSIFKKMKQEKGPVEN